MTRGARVLTVVAAALAASVGTGGALLVTAAPAMADDCADGHASGLVTGGDATGSADCLTPAEGTQRQPDGYPTIPPSGDGPACHYEAPRWTTQDEQRNDIRADETGGREGLWGWRVCDDGTEEFVFFPDGPDGEAQLVDPRALADSVTITPQVPTLRTSPPLSTNHLVNLASWFWIDPGDWDEVSEDARAGPVVVTVTATPRTLVVDPGDDSPTLECAGGGTPYARGASSDCTHTYERSGNYDATVTIVYDVAFTSNIGVDGNLGPLTPDEVTVDIPVYAAEALNND
jgi:hypothetical protein